MFTVPSFCRINPIMPSKACMQPMIQCLCKPMISRWQLTWNCTDYFLIKSQAAFIFIIWIIFFSVNCSCYLALQYPRPFKLLIKPYLIVSLHYEFFPLFFFVSWRQNISPLHLPLFGSSNSIVSLHTAGEQTQNNKELLG